MSFLKPQLIIVMQCANTCDRRLSTYCNRLQFFSTSLFNESNMSSIPRSDSYQKKNKKNLAESLDAHFHIFGRQRGVIMSGFNFA